MYQYQYLRKCVSWGVVLCTHDTNIAIYCRYPLVRFLLQQFRGDQLLEREDDAVFTSYADCRATVFYRLYRVFDLEVAAIG